ncbi:MAG TPA: threonine/serine exporter family protein [Lachnospiraceae bacterium]|nr:threonine/serine exporter family protein [Lachnospiraceae bacterium]HEX3076174.1 threonine/serine exporter family protein [Lachnospiraceae bacterium]
MIGQFIAAVFGTIAFSILFNVPKQYYPWCGLTGGVGWICYLLVLKSSGVVEASFVATCLVVLLSRFFAIHKKCPVTIFLISGIFPLVPGAGIYWTAYYIIMDQYKLASSNGFETLKIAVAIVLGIIFVFEIPQGVFRLGIKKEVRNGVKENRGEDRG